MKNLLLAILVFTTSILNAQIENRYEVTVRLKNGDMIEAMVQLDSNHPWSDQKSITVFDRSLVDQARIKRKQRTKYKASKVEYFEIEGRRWESHKVMMPEGEYGGTLKGVPTATFLERIEAGDISVFKGYSYPPGMITGGEITYEDIYNDIKNNPNYFVIKHANKKAKVKYISNINIEKWIKDAPDVYEKFEAGEYGNFKRKKGKKLGNFIKGQIENENPDLIIRIIQEYNEEMQ
ncbi:MAG: hypothetical protein AB8H03_26565 [Saprospiraceae bacterium]